MEIYLVTLAFSALAVTTTMLAMSRLIPDEYDRRRPARVAVVGRRRRAAPRA